MDKDLFNRSILAYIQVARGYVRIEKALYGESIGESSIFDYIYQIQENLCEAYLKEIFISDYVNDAIEDYLSQCVFENKNFNISDFDKIVNEALDEECKDALKDS